MDSNIKIVKKGDKTFVEVNAPDIGWHNAGLVEDVIKNWPDFAEDIQAKLDEQD